MNPIKNIIEPDQLLLAWQAIDTKERERFVVGELVREHESVIFRYLPSSPEIEKAKQLGFAGYPAFRYKTPTHSCQVVETFLTRLPPKSRDDYGIYLKKFGLTKDQQMSDLARLGYLKAKLPGDGFELVHTFETVKECPFECIIEVAGFRYKSQLTIDAIEIDSVVEFVPEPTNPVDDQAIAILYSGKIIGYVDKVRTRIFHRLAAQGATVTGRVHSRNGTSKRPLIHIYVEVSYPHLQSKVA